MQSTQSTIATIVSGMAAARLAWHLALAAMLPLFALPWWTQELHGAVGGLPWPGYHEVGQVSPDELRSSLWGMWCLWATLLAFALWIPHHPVWFRGVRLPVLCEEVNDAKSYRAPPARTRVLGARAARSLQAIYCVRLGVALLFLWLPLVSAACLARHPTSWSSSVMGSGLVFAAPHEYLPVLIASIAALLSLLPTADNLLGPFATALAADHRVAR